MLKAFTCYYIVILMMGNKKKGLVQLKDSPSLMLLCKNIYKVESGKSGFFVPLEIYLMFLKRGFTHPCRKYMKRNTGNRAQVEVIH